MKALKFGLHKESDNVETMSLIPVIQEFLEEITPAFEGYNSDQISEFEFKSRSGFWAHDHNRGGLDLIVINDLRGLMGSGEYMGLKIEKQVNKDYETLWNDIKQDNPELNEENEKDLEKLYELVDEAGSCEYQSIAWRVRVMYEGNGVLMVYAGYDFDAPYFRWGNAADFEHKIEFKTLKGLKTQLKKLVSKIEKSQ